MNYRVFISFAALAFVLLMAIAGSTGCANIIPPAGGPRDSLPPVLIKAVPADSSRNFEGNRINFTFDEYIQLDNFSQNAIISPVPKIAPTATFRLNTVSVRLRDSLEPNTTYSINFGGSIKDVNESNILKDFTYIFSTGPAIDSLTFRGTVILAENGQIDSTLIVVLHTNPDDSAVVKERPRYMTRVDSKGNFLFRNLPADTFYVYALKDDSRTLRYLNKQKLFAFADSAAIVRQNPGPLILYAYEAEKPRQVASSTTETRNASDKRLRYRTSIKANAKQDLLQPFRFTFEQPLDKFDSSKVHFSSDTLYTPVSGYSWSMDTTRKIVTLNYTWKENTLYHLVLEKDFATDTLGHQLLKEDTLDLTTLKSSDYGKLSLRFRNLDLSVNPVLQFVQGGEVVNSFPLAGSTFSQALFLPGDYELRILHDNNKNGVWDPGEFFGRHIQPEIVKPVERKINVKGNWDNEIEIIL